MSWRRVVRGIGKTLIASGVLILLFVVYQLWGTNLAEARSQRKLKREFAQLLESTTTTKPGTANTTPAPPTPPPPPQEGSAIAIIKIPRIGVEKAVVEGVDVSDLKKGPGHYPTTPVPGEPGNAAIAGHRTTYGAPFSRLDELQADDVIFLTTRTGKFEYRVNESRVVRPSENQVLAPSQDNRLTLTTCHPRYSAAKRLIVGARLIGTPTEPPPPSPDTLPGDPGAIVGARNLATLEDRSTSGDRSARWPAFLWAMVCASVWLLAWAVGRDWRKWPAYVIATPVFLVFLYLFFENFSRLLPANF